jgi:integrase
LLTAQRRDEAASMRWGEVSGDVWTIPADRYKTKRQNAVPLTEDVWAILDTLPRIKVEGLTEAETFVFTTTGNKPFSGFSKTKAAPDDASGITGWTLHDLRRTARTLMVRAGVRPDVAERVLGYVIHGVAGVYGRHELPKLAQRKE